MKRKILVTLLISVLTMQAALQTVFAGSGKYISWIDNTANERIYSINVTDTYNQTKAREIAEEINKHRVEMGGVPLKYSTIAENAAMRRAAESVFMYDHLDPVTFKFSSDLYSEVLTLGNSNDDAVRVTNRWWNSPGHKAILTTDLSGTKDYCLGVGFFGGVAVGVLCRSDGNVGSTSDINLPSPFNGTKTVTIKSSNRLVMEDKVINRWNGTIVDEFSLREGETILNPGQKSTTVTDATSDFEWLSDLGWTSSNPNVVRVDGKNITGVSPGTATLTAHPYSKNETTPNTWTVKVNVVDKNSSGNGTITNGKLDRTENIKDPAFYEIYSCYFDNNIKNNAKYYYNHFSNCLSGDGKTTFISSNPEIFNIKDDGTATLNTSTIKLGTCKTVRMTMTISETSEYNAKTISFDVKIYNHSYIKKYRVGSCSGSKQYNYECVDCCRSFGDIYGQTEPDYSNSTGHALVHYNKKSATCKASGMQEHYRCSGCKKYFTTSKKETTASKLVIKKTSHKYQNKADSKYLASKLKCGSKPKYYKSCKYCGVKSKSTFYASKALAHNYSTVIKKATSSKDGYYYSKCSRCKKSTKKVTICRIKTVALDKTEVEYIDTDTADTPKVNVIVKDSKNKTISSKYYTLTYVNDFSAGKGKVTVTFKDRYSGTITKGYIIRR